MKDVATVFRIPHLSSLFFFVELYGSLSVYLVIPVVVQQEK